METKTLKLNQLTDYRSGLWAGKTDALTPAKVIRVTEMRENGTYDLSTAKELDVETKKLETRRVAPSTILLERSGGGENKPVGRVIFFGDDVLGGVYSFSNFTTLLLPNTNLVDPKYLFYALYFFHLSGQTKSLQKAVTGIRNLEFPKYLEQEILIPFKDGEPDFIEQKRIVEKLDKVFAETEKGLSIIRKKDARTSALKQSLLSRIFDDSLTEKQTLSEIADVNPKKSFGELKDSDEVSFVPMNSVDEYTGSISKRQIRQLGSVSKGYTFFQNGDVIFAKITPCMENGKCAVAKELTNGVGFGSTEFYVVRPKDNVLPEYLWYFLRQESVRKEAVHHFTGAAGQKRVPKDFIESLELPIPLKNGKPDIAEQKRIVAKLEKAVSLSDKISFLLKKQEVLFANLHLSVLKATFTQELQNAQAIPSPIQYSNSPLQQAIALVLRRFQRGEMVVAKVLYLGQTVFKIPLGVQFTQQSFGPYSADIKISVKDGLSSQKQFFVRKGTTGLEVLSLGARGEYVLKASDASIRKQMTSYLDQMMPHYFSSDSQSIELLATICKIIEDEKAADDAVICKKLQEWKPNKFSETQISRTVGFIRKNNWDQKILN